ncbi:hypothetical protein [Enterococcus sp. DIV0691]
MVQEVALTKNCRRIPKIGGTIFGFFGLFLIARYGTTFPTVD